MDGADVEASGTEVRAALQSSSSRFLWGELCKAPCNGGVCAQVVDNMCRRPGTERSCLNWFVTWSVATSLSAYSSGWHIAIKYWIAMMNMLPPM